MTERTGRWMIASAITAALLLAGATTIIAGALTPVSFGWFAYQPLADATFGPHGEAVFLSRTVIIGFTIFALGLLALAFLAGWRLAKRQTA